MPQFGLKTIEAASPADASGIAPPPWKLPGAEVAQIAFEMDLEASLDLLPAQLSRPVPPFGRISVTRFPESPVGPYSEALLILSARFAMVPRNYVVAAVVTSEAARAAYAAIWGLPAVVGTVDLRRERNDDGTEQIIGRIAAGSPVATIELPHAYAVEPAMIRYDPLVSVRNTGAEPELIQFSGAPVVKEGRLAKGASAVCNTDAWADPWFRLRSLNTISATFAVADLELTEPVVQRAGAGAGMGGGLP